jgi:hypothetical protein
MAAMTHVYPRSTGVYEYRRLIPEKLRPAFGGKRWRIETLDTKDKAEAKRKGSVVDVRIAEEFRLAEAGEWPPISADMIEVLANHFLRSVDQEQITDDRALTDALMKFLIQRNIPFREGGTTFGHFKAEVCLWMRDPPDPPPSTVVREKPVVALKTNNRLLPITMMNIIDGWARDNEPTEKTVYSWKRIMAKLTAHVGHDDVTQIGDTDIVSWKEALLASSLSRKTVANHLTIATTLFNWAERN